MQPTDTPRHTPSDTDQNWLKGPAPLRAYTAQRDHFLELHARRAALRGQEQIRGRRQTGEEGSAET